MLKMYLKSAEMLFHSLCVPLLVFSSTYSTVHCTITVYVQMISLRFRANRRQEQISFLLLMCIFLYENMEIRGQTV